MDFINICLIGHWELGLQQCDKLDAREMLNMECEVMAQQVDRT